MSLSHYSDSALILLLAFMLTMLGACNTTRQSNTNEAANLSKLGTVDFPTSCSCVW